MVAALSAILSKKYDRGQVKNDPSHFLNSSRPNEASPPSCLHRHVSDHPFANLRGDPLAYDDRPKDQQEHHRYLFPGEDVD